MVPFSKADTLEKLIKEFAYQAKDLDATKALREESREDALRTCSRSPCEGRCAHK